MSNAHVTLPLLPKPILSSQAPRGRSKASPKKELSFSFHEVSFDENILAPKNEKASFGNAPPPHQALVQFSSLSSKEEALVPAIHDLVSDFRIPASQRATLSRFVLPQDSTAASLARQHPSVAMMAEMEKQKLKEQMEKNLQHNTDSYETFSKQHSGLNI